MFTVIETKAFVRNMENVWQNTERQEFINWIAATPDAGDLVVGTGGLRKVRWSRQGIGKRGGVRVVTYEVRSDGVVWCGCLLVIPRPNLITCPPTFLIH